MTPVMMAVFSALPLLLLLIGLVFSVLTNTYIERAQKKVMLAFLVLVTLLVLQNAAEFILENADSLHWALRIFTGVAGYTLRPIIPALFITFIAGGKKSLRSAINITPTVKTLDKYIKLGSSFSENYQSDARKYGFGLDKRGFACLYGVCYYPNLLG